MLIGMGGGAASSMATGANTADLDFDSVQRGNAEIQRRAQEVIDRCWQLGDANPILSIHDVGAGGLSNALPELVHGGGAGGAFDLRAMPSRRAGHVAARDLVQRGAGALRAGDRAGDARRVSRDLRARALSVRRRRHARRPSGGSSSTTAHFGNQPVDMDARRAARQAAEDDARCRARRRASCRRSTLAAIDARATRRIACCSCPAVADKTFLVTIGDRTVGGLCARDPMVGPWQVPVADVAVTLMDFDGYRRRGDGDGRAHAARADRCAGVGAHGGRRGDHQYRRRRHRAACATSSSRPTGWRRPGIRARTRRCTTRCARSRMELCPALGISIPVGKDSMSMRTTWRDGGVDKAVTAPVSLIVSAFAPVADARRALTPQLAPRSRRHRCCCWIDLGGGSNRLGGSALAQVYGQLGDEAPDLDDPALLAAFFAPMQALHATTACCSRITIARDGGLFADAGRDGVRRRAAGSTIVARRAAGIRCRSAVRRGARRGRAGACRDRARRRRRVRGRGPALRLRSARRRATAAFASSAMARRCSTTSRVDLHRAWSATTHALQRLRDNPDAADQEYERISRRRRSGPRADA